uniref:snRNA-activating protein complex subunit 4-like n=1 Tax=Sinocyclocheilus grahami TaxID=75366 RepID=A0A672MXU3_SINGR
MESNELLEKRDQIQREILALESTLGADSSIINLLSSDSSSDDDKSDDSGPEVEGVGRDDLEAERLRIQREIEELENTLGANVLEESEHDTDSRYEDSDDDELDLPQNVETCLQMNLVYQEVLKEKLAELEQLLNENQQQQKEIEAQISGPSTSSSSLPGIPPQKQFLGYFMKPYFKDKLTGLGPPANEETKTRLSHGTRPIDELKIKRWNGWQKTLLTNAVAKDTMKRMLQPKLSKLDYLSAKMSRAADEGKEELKKQIDLIEKEIVEISALKDDQLLGNLHDDHDWEKISNIDFEALRQADDLKRFWQNYLHPSIDKSVWKRDEIVKLKGIVEEYNCCHWDKIAEALGTNRTAFMCFQTYQRYISKTFRRKEWTKVEDEILRKLVEKMRIGNFIPYIQMSYFMEGRDGSQLAYRWTSVLDPSLKKGPWSKEEDQLLRNAVAKYGTKEWGKIRLEVPGRTDGACRDRYLDCLQENVKKGPWSKEEVELLKEKVEKYGVGKWSKIASEIPNRIDCQCLHKWKLLTQAVSSFFNISYLEIPQNMEIPRKDYVQPDMKEWIPVNANTVVHSLGAVRTVWVCPPTIEDELEESTKILVFSRIRSQKSKCPKVMLGFVTPILPTITCLMSMFPSYGYLAPPQKVSAMLKEAKQKAEHKKPAEPPQHPPPLQPVLLNLPKQPVMQMTTPALIHPKTLVITQPNKQRAVQPLMLTKQKISLLPQSPPQAISHIPLPLIQQTAPAQAVMASTSKSPSVEVSNSDKSTKRIHKPTEKVPALMEEAKAKGSKKKSLKRNQGKQNVVFQTITLQTQPVNWILAPTKLVQVTGPLSANIPSNQTLTVPNISPLNSSIRPCISTNLYPSSSALVVASSSVNPALICSSVTNASRETLKTSSSVNISPKGIQTPLSPTSTLVQSKSVLHSVQMLSPAPKEDQKVSHIEAMKNSSDSSSDESIVKPYQTSTSTGSRVSPAVFSVLPVPLTVAPLANAPVASKPTNNVAVAKSPGVNENDCVPVRTIQLPTVIQQKSLPDTILSPLSTSRRPLRPIAPSPQFIAQYPNIVAPLAQIVALSPHIVAPSPRIVAPPTQIVAPSPRIVAAPTQIVAPSPWIVAPSPQIAAPPPQIVAPSEVPQIITSSEPLIPLPDIPSDVVSFNPHLIFPEQSSEVDDWMNGKGGIPLLHLEMSLPYLPPSAASIETLTSLLKVKQSLLAAAVNILPDEYQNYREEEDQVAAIRKMIAERFASNPAYLLLKARFLSCFTLPALLATINPSEKFQLPTDNNGDDAEVLYLQKRKKRIQPPATVSCV